MNNHVWYHNATEDSKSLVNEREYLSTVDAIKLSSRFAVVLSDGKVSIHSIEPGGPADRGTMVRGVVVWLSTIWSLVAVFVVAVFAVAVVVWHGASGRRGLFVCV